VLMAIFVSNCGLVHSKRNEWIKELMHETKVDSFGRCHHNKGPSEKGKAIVDCNLTIT
jgi:hypothetical protein